MSEPGGDPSSGPVARFSQTDEYRCLSLMRASAVVNCQCVVGISIIFPSSDFDEGLFVRDAWFGREALQVGGVEEGPVREV
jgi:hypothetical protein